MDTQKKEANRNEGLEIAFKANAKYLGYVHVGIFELDSFGEQQFIADYSRRIDQITQYVDGLRIHKDYAYYIIANTMKTSKERNQANLFSLNNMVLDLDIHGGNKTTEEKQVLLQQFADVLETELKEQNIEVWNLLHFTGQGAHLWWCCEQVSLNLYWPWTITLCRLVEAVDKVLKLHEEFSCIELDKAASKSPERYYRLFDTTNLKTGTTTKLLVYNSIPYKLQSLIECLNEKYVVNKIMRIGKGKSSSEKDFVEVMNRIRMQLVENLVIGRNALAGAETRHNYLHFYYNCAVGVYDLETAKEKTRKMNAKFKAPLSENDLKSIFRYIDKLHNSGFIRKYKNSTIIELFNITEHEQLKYNFKPAGSRWDWEICIPNRTRDLERATRKQEKQEKYSKVLSYYEAGFTQREIAKKLKISHGTVNSLLIAENADRQRDRKVQIQWLKEDGLTQKAVAEFLEVSLSTVKRAWNLVAA